MPFITSEVCGAQTAANDSNFHVSNNVKHERGPQSTCLTLLLRKVGWEISPL